MTGFFAEPLLKRDQSKYLYLATLFTYTVSSFLVSLNTTFQWLASYMAVVGFLHGLSVSLSFIVTLEIVGIAAYPEACGLIIFVSSISWTIGPPLAGSFSACNIRVREIKKQLQKEPYIPLKIRYFRVCQDTFNSWCNVSKREAFHQQCRTIFV